MIFGRKEVREPALDTERDWVHVDSAMTIPIQIGTVQALAAIVAETRRLPVTIDNEPGPPPSTASETPSAASICRSRWRAPRKGRPEA